MAYRCPPRKWDFMPMSGQEVNYDDILAGKRFWENLEKEYKGKAEHKKEDNKWSFLKHWSFLGIISPIFGLLYAYIMVELVLSLVHTIKNVSIN